MAAFTTFTERLDMSARMGVAYTFMAAMFILNIIAIPFPLTGAIKAPFFLIGLYYWMIYRPALLPAWLVFLVGCAMDLLSGLPLGLNALIFVVVRWRVAEQRRFLMGQSFMMVWTGFGIVCVSAGLGQWGIFGLTQMHWPPVQQLLASMFFGISLFPVVCVILHLIHKILPIPHAVMRPPARG